MKRFLAIGECMVELAQIAPDTYKRGFAGDTFNTAWYARRLLPDDWTVGYVSAIGTDAVSDEMVAFMAGQGIDTSTLRRVPDRTVGLYMISVEDGERSFSYWRSQSAARLLAEDADWMSNLFADLSSDTVLYFSGITLAILSSDHRTRLCDHLVRARDNGVTVAFDTNLRPRLWASKDEMQAGMMQGAASASIVLPSFDEEQILFGDTSPDQTIVRYRDCGATTVAVKNSGGDLTLWGEKFGQVTVAAQPVTQVVDSTAAGDSFGAGFLSGLATCGDPTTAAAKAMALAAQVIQRRGALAPDIFEGGEI